MKPGIERCSHPRDMLHVEKRYRTCVECLRELLPETKQCSCGVKAMEPLFEDCICLECEYSFTRYRDSGREPGR